MCVSDSQPAAAPVQLSQLFVACKEAKLWWATLSLQSEGLPVCNMSVLLQILSCMQDDSEL